MAAEWPLAVFAQLAETLPQLDHRGVVASIDVPVLLLHGRHDEKTRYDGATYLLEHLPRARLVTLEQSAHCPHLEEPGRLNEALLEFLEDVATAAPPTAAAAAS